MIKALAPGLRWGCSWVWLSIALAGGFPPALFAQAAKVSSPASKKTGTAKTGPSPKAEGKPPAGGDEAPPAETPLEPKTSTIEVFKDPRAEAALRVFKSIPGINKPFPERDIRTILSQAEGGGPADRDLLQRFVSGMAFALIDKTSINALINPSPGSRLNAEAARGVQRAADHLLDVYHTARRAKNAGFLATYNDLLVDTLPKLLDGNLISRIQAMIVLGNTGSPRAVPIFVAQLKDPKQTVWVKYWAARGLSNLVENGVKLDSVPIPIEVPRTIADVLTTEKDLPWPVRMRLLEALGSMRIASMPTGQKVEMATAAMDSLADPEAHPEVRAQAAWALGMFRVNSSTRDYNYALITYYTGQVAADLGEQIEESAAENKALSEYLTGLLLVPIHQAFNGLDGARESGLLKVPGGNSSMPYTRQVADLTATLSRAAVELVRGPTGQIPKNQKILAGHVETLKTFLAKNPPKSFKLVPGGRDFPPESPQVAKAPVENEGVAGGPGR